MKIFFIVGRGRSGTWLLKSILDAHPQICVAPESLFIETFYSKYHKISKWSEKNKLRFVNDLFEDDRIASWWDLDRQLLTTKILEAEVHSYSQICLIPYELYAEHNNKTSTIFIGDKNPGYTLRIDLLKSLFPDSKFIAMVRDVRDNILSFQNVNFDFNNIFILAGRWKSYLECIERARNDYSYDILTIFFEDLISAPEKKIREICSFLHIEYSEDLLLFYKNPKNVLAWNKKIASPFDPSTLYKWKKDSQILKLKDAYFLASGNNDLIVENISLSNRILFNVGKLITKLEFQFFYVPVFIKQPLIKMYRRLTKTI